MEPRDQDSPPDLAPKAIPAGELPPRGVAPTKSCPHCGKKFYGRPPAQCPACLFSTEGGESDRLDQAAPAFVRQLSWGALMLAFSIPLHTLGIILNLIQARPLKGITHLLAAALVLAGVMLLTRRDARLVERYAKTATRARILVSVCALLWLVLAYFACIQASTVFIRDTVVEAALACQTVLAWELAAFCRYLALRVPDDSRAGALYTGGCCVALICALFTGVQFVGMYDPIFVIMMTWPFPLTEVLIGILGWCTLSLVRLATDMRACATEAENIVYKKLHPRQVAKYEAKIDL